MAEDMFQNPETEVPASPENKRTGSHIIEETAMETDETSFLNETPTDRHPSAKNASPTAQAEPDVLQDATDATALSGDIADIARDAARLAEDMPEQQIESSRTESIRVDAGERTVHDDNVGDVRHDIGHSVDTTVASKPGDSAEHDNQTPVHSGEKAEDEDGSEEGESKDSVNHTSEESAGDADEEVKYDSLIYYAYKKGCTLMWSRTGEIWQKIIPDKRTGRSVRVRNPPKRLGQTPEEKAKHDEEEDTAVYNALALVSPRKQKALTTLMEGRQKKDLYVLGQPVTKTFYKDLYKPRSFVSTTHMEAMMAMTWARRGDSLLSNRVAIMDAFFCNYLIQEHNRFLKVKNPPVPFPWNRPMQNYVAGIVPNRSGRLRWFEDVDYVYAVMNWGTNHWVGLSINLLNGSVNIMDCNQDLYGERKLPKLMKPVTEILPLLLRDLVDNAYEKPESFDYCRDIGLPQDARGGDCGPLTAKFVELSSQGLSLDDLASADIDNMRMKYAVDVYEENQEPL